MHSTTIAASALAFAASAMAQVAGFAVMSSPAKDEDVPAGSVYNIVWAANNHNGLVDVTLMAGATPETLQLGNKIASKIYRSLPDLITCQPWMLMLNHSRR